MCSSYFDSAAVCAPSDLPIQDECIQLHEGTKPAMVSSPVLVAFVVANVGGLGSVPSAVAHRAVFLDRGRKLFDGHPAELHDEARLPELF
jgi:hypothetical protein